MSRLSQAIEQIEFSRRYTLELLDSTDRADWFLMPGGVTHVAWQVGHLAMADYRLLLERIRGPRDEDEQLISGRLLALFGRGSVPTEGTAGYPTPSELIDLLNLVRAAALTELNNLADEELDNPTLAPHRLFQTKLGALRWCGSHELVHAGQIGLLRRLTGGEVVW